MHEILSRQLRQYLRTENVPDDVPRLRELLQAVSDTYTHFDESRLLTERSLELTSREMTEINSLLSGTLESTMDGILVVSLSGKILVSNRRFAEMWGIPDSVMALRDDGSALDHVLSLLVDPKAFIDKVRELYSNQATSFDVLNFKDGRIFERYSQPLIVDGKLTGRVWSFRDVTEKIRAAASHEERAEELEKINSYMVGRELRMAELKKENEGLKARLTELEKTADK